MSGVRFKGSSQIFRGGGASFRGLAAAGTSNQAFLTTAPDFPTTEKTVTWEAAGDPTVSPVTETTNCWSDDGGTTTYSTLDALIGAQTSDVSLNMPQGEFILSTTAINDTAYTVAIVGHASGTAIQVSIADACFKLNTATTTAGYYFKDLTVGAFDAAISAHTFGVDPITNLQEGAWGIFLVRGGDIVLDTVTIRFTGDDGLGADTTYEKLTGGLGIRDTSRVLSYNCEIYGCGNGIDEHNIYLHAVPSYFYRLWSHDCPLGHALKYDGEMVILNQCSLANDWTSSYSFTGSTTINVTWPSDLIIKDCFVYKQVDTSDRQVISIASRRNAGGRGFSKRLEPWWEQDQTAGNSRSIQWKNGGTGTTNDFYGARVSSYSAGTPSVTLKNMVEVSTGGLTTITNTTTTDYWRIDWGGETRLATKGNGTDVFTLASAFSGTPVANDILVVYPDSAGQDVPYLNEKMWNPNHASYYWGTIDNAGSLDLTAYANYPLHLFDGNMFVQDVNSITNGRLYDIYAHPAEMYIASTPKLVDLPMAPLSGESSTNTWSDAAYGSLDFGGAQNIFSGDEATTPEAILPLLVGFADSCLIIENGTTTTSGFVSTDTDANVDLATGAPLDPTMRYISGGSVNTISNISTTNWFPTTADTTTSATSAVDATTITVNSITGFSDGQTIRIEYAFAAGSKPVYTGTINGTPSGSTITVTPALDRAVASGARVSAVSAAGSKPAWFMSIEDIWNTRRVA